MTIKNNQFIENTVTNGTGFGYGSGGAIYLNLPYVPVSIEGCSFIGNVSTAAVTDAANFGGGAINILKAVFTNPIKNCIFRDNKITHASEGSAIFTKVALTLQNCVFANNSAVVSGSTFFTTVDGCKIQNSTFANNYTTGTGRPIDTTSKIFTLTNSVFSGNTVFTNALANATTGTTATYNAFDTDQSTYTYYGTGSIKTITNANTFVNPTSFIGVPTDATQKSASASANWSMLIGSPAVDAGTDLTALGVTTDITGLSRPVGTAFDMGAYERSSVSTSLNSVKNTLQCFSKNKNIEVNNLNKGENVTVYGISGNIVSSQNATNTSMSIPLSQGIYIVRICNRVSKVIVK